MTQNKIPRIVLTGGPCAGKTTAMARISKHFGDLGIRVYVVPEAATVLLSNGVKHSDLNGLYAFDFQAKLINLQMSLEQTFDTLARELGGPALLVCDRGMMDSKAFTPPDIWQGLLDHHGWSDIGLRDKHYDAVIHLVTTAIGAEEFYTLDNNNARQGSPADARAADVKLRAAWTGHPHLRVIDNSTGFEEKINRVISMISNVIGAPDPLEIEKKFLVKGDFTIDYPEGLSTKTVEIEQTYLQVERDVVERVRRRGYAGSNVYTHTIKEHVSPGRRVERERHITAKEYLACLNRASPKHATIHKKRTCFLWKDKYFEFDEFVNRQPGLRLLEIELEHEDDKFELPPFLEIVRDVTGEPAYSNVRIAKRYAR